MEENTTTINDNSAPQDKILYKDGRMVGYVFKTRTGVATDPNLLKQQNQLDMVKSIKNLEVEDIVSIATNPNVLKNDLKDENGRSQIVNAIIDIENYPLETLPEDVRKSIILARQSKQQESQELTPKSR